MKLNVCRIPGGNFGDDLNDLIWPELFPNLLELNNDIELYGIGTILGGKIKKSGKRVVLGSGLGYKKPQELDNDWEIRWLRGKFSAKVLGLDAKYALGDGAVLWSELKPVRSMGDAIGFIPHHASWESYDWQTVADQAGLLAINPKQSPKHVADQIRQCRAVICESLHGAIFADCLQVPWHSVVLSYRFNNFKWKDWLSLTELPFSPSISPCALSYPIDDFKQIKNRVARVFLSDNDTRYSSLRIVRTATEADQNNVIKFLTHLSQQDHLFACSSLDALEHMRNQMTIACREFAREYELTCTI
jgi:succinoglycan biosynthesis protein ExoV